MADIFCVAIVQAGYSAGTIETRLETPVVRSYLWLDFKSKAKVKVKEEDKKLIRNQMSAQNMLAIARDVSLNPRTSNQVSDKQRRLD